MFALDLLRVPLARIVLVGLEMPRVGAPIIGVIAGDPKGGSYAFNCKNASSVRRPQTYANTLPVW